MSAGSRALGALLWVVPALGGCVAELLPGELALPGEVPALRLVGPLGFGRALTVDGDGVLIGGEGEVWRAGPEGLEQSWLAPGEVSAVGRVQGQVLAFVPGVGVVELGEQRLVAPLAEGTVAAFGSSTWLAATPEGVLFSDGSWQEVSDPRALFTDDQRHLALVCNPVCGAVELTEGGVIALGEAGPAGRVGLYAADPIRTDPAAGDGAGEVRGAEGVLHRGEPGDQLGVSLCVGDDAGFAGGVVNGSRRPNRALLVPLEPGLPPLGVQLATPGRPPSLACGGGLLAIGAPVGAAVDPPAGVVLVADLDRLRALP